MLVELLCVDEEDDPGFGDRILAIVHGLLSRFPTRELWIVKLDHWFDHKWLGFSGHGPYGSRTSLDPLFLPSFHPNRILCQYYWVRDEGGHLRRPMKPVILHPGKFNGHEPQLSTITKSGLMVWFSGNTKQNCRGSLMVYVVEPNKPWAWYAAISKDRDWTTCRLKGITELELELLENTPKT